MREFLHRLLGFFEHDWALAQIIGTTAIVRCCTSCDHVEWID